MKNLKLDPNMALQINPNFVQYVTDSIIVFISGCNIILYDLNIKKQIFLMKKNTHRRITFLSVGSMKIQQPGVDLKSSQRNINQESIDTDNYIDRNDIKDKLICLGEYSDIENDFYITFIRPSNQNIQYSVKSTEKFYEVNFCSILNNTHYCVSISQKKFSNKTSSNNISSKISFSKYSYETFICQETIPEELTYCCYNPKNTIELVICGKGYLRLWNVFINEGALKEHQQRFLRGKKEKEHNFIKAQFFEKKSFLLIVGTKENMFYIIDSFQVIHEINMCYLYENIYDLNIQNLLHFEENDDIGNLKENIDSLTKNDLDDQLKKISVLTSAPIKKINNIQKNSSSLLKSESSSLEENKSQNLKSENESSKMDVFKRLYKSKNDEYNDGKINRNNRVKFFELINDNLLFVIYANDGCSLLYKIDWNKKMLDGETEEDFRKWKVADCRIIRLAKNIKSVLGFSMFKPKNDIILIVDSFDELDKKRSNISLFKMKKIIIKEKKNQISNMLNFEFELFNGYFEKYTIKFIDLCEKKQSIYIVDTNNYLKIFDIRKKQYIINKQFKDNIFSLSVNPSTNYFALGFDKKVSVLGKLRDDIKTFCELEVTDSILQWNNKGDYLVICGLNRNTKQKKKSYCLYFVETKTFNTINVFENLLNKVKRIKFIDNDRYLFCLSSNSYIMGMYLNIYNDCMSFHELGEQGIKSSKESIVSNNFKLIFTHNAHGKNYSDIDYDSKLGLVVALEDENNKMYILSSSNKNKNNALYPNNNIYNEINCNLKTIKIVKELQVLIGGDNNGFVNIYKWPFKDFETNEAKNINDNLIYFINLDLNQISQILNFQNFSKFICITDSSHIFICNLLLPKGNNDYLTFEYFQKGSKPQVEILVQPYEMYDSNLDQIVKKEVNVYILNQAMEKLKIIMDEDIEEMNNIFNMEMENMENNIKQSTENEISKYEHIDNEIKELKNEMTTDMHKRLEDMENNRIATLERYNNKINLYDEEIERLKNEFQGIKDSIEEKYNIEAEQQRVDYEQLLTDYNEKYKKLREETHKSLVQLVNLSSEYDEANDKIINDYKTLITNLDQKIQMTLVNNDNILKEEDEKLKSAKILEEQHKEKLEQKVKDSDKLIEKNVEIKQSIINVTQRTITFQEQLLETEKNLVKIDKKLEDLIVKNKHLEQIRFVLEHRMTSLEKEKSPLEGQCAFLENQKNKLTEEFNKIILQINKNNQELENKQSQLRASLIQNYEIHDQKNYVEAKLMQLKNDIEQFLMNYQDSDEEKTLGENKATYVALNFKHLYDKFFSTSIDDELLNYQFYSQKLQEQTDKDGIANNFDLIMRNKAEEKLTNEKAKVEELIDAKERGFKRIQNENTILITECNRLRKNLHEIYMHVVDIEQRFESLTKIDPKVSKSEIVRQIKEFIRITHEKIKENYSQTKNDLIQPKKKILKKITLNTGNNNIKKNKNKNGSHFTQTESNMNEIEDKEVNHTEANAYVIFPEIRSSKNKFKTNNKKDSKNNTGFSLPVIEK